MPRQRVCRVGRRRKNAIKSVSCGYPSPVAPPLLILTPGMDLQRTIRRKVSVEGIGLHSCEPVQLTLTPAAADTGILFRAADGTLVPADIEHVVDGRAATTVGAFVVLVRPIEHLMPDPAALLLGERGE